MIDRRTKLGDYAGATFQFTCLGCQHASEISATQLMMRRGGAALLKDVLSSFKCTQCARTGAPEMTIND